MIVTADIYDHYHRTVEVCDWQFRSFGQRRAFYGPCETIWSYEDHRPVLEALKQEGRGRVLVVDAGGSLRIGVLGDRLAAIGMANGWVGVVVNGAVRDSVGLDALDIGVKAAGVTARRADIATEGAGPRIVGFGGIRFAPGQWVYADEDCILVSPEQLDLEQVTAPPVAAEYR
ncbi:MAG TPA: ribonuclease E activity regulator RraA [Bosea sp. (in: a-proteobacteria)]|jgi:regulator of ribonuclease activity A|uniref:ribonuclease E activity regulator RraA n=1 Tax=Bosea sp. (in: a-proteobacteria) TaxID=1871050 RepID=UPI002E0E438F|nr:ribonuclease E activity regulator RraA [Bosea sp. (in: a-proteobacteria)]